MDNHGRIVRLLKDVPPIAGKNIHLTLDLHLQEYIESLLAGQRAAVLVEDPHDGSVLAMVSMPSYDPNPFVKGISYQDYGKLLHDKNLPLINRVTQGLYPRRQRLNPIWRCPRCYAGLLRRKPPSLARQLDASRHAAALPGLEKTGHGMLDVTKAIEESADTFFYQVAYMMGIDRIDTMLSQFGYGKPTGIDLNEEYDGLLPSRAWKQRVHKSSASGRYHPLSASAVATGLPPPSRW